MQRPGIQDVAENVLSYEHFDKTRHWYQKRDFSHIEDERQRKEAGWELARHYREKEGREVEVRVQTSCSLNGRAPQLFIDPEVNLAAEPRTLWPKPWIVPLTTP